MLPSYAGILFYFSSSGVPVYQKKKFICICHTRRHFFDRKALNMVTHLPPSIKHLLSLRNPNSLPSPSLPILHAVLKRTQVDAKAKRAETGWLVLATCTLLTVNRPSTVGYLYRFVTGPNSDGLKTRNNIRVSHAINIAAIMRESALKCTIFVGVPRVILSLAALHEALDNEVKAALRKNSHRYKPLH